MMGGGRFVVRQLPMPWSPTGEQAIVEIPIPPAARILGASAWIDEYEIARVCLDALIATNLETRTHPERRKFLIVVPGQAFLVTRPFQHVASFRVREESFFIFEAEP